MDLSYLHDRAAGGMSALLGPDGRPLDGPEKPYDAFALPHVLTYGSLFNAAARTYWHDRFDEAMRFGRDAALAMRRDPYLLGLLQERKLAVSSLNWHLEVPDDKDPLQVMVREHLTKTLRAIPFLHRLVYALLDAIWYGRYGVQVRYAWEHTNGRRSLTLADWLPVNGDKIEYHYDGTPYVLVYTGAQTDLKGAQTTHTTRGKAISLTGSWRQRFFIHKHEVDDADYFDAEAAGGVHGVGIRSRLFWIDWMEKEYLEWITTYMERVGLGLTIWFYEAGNAASKDEAENAARKQSNRTNIVWPRSNDGKGGAGVERIETPASGSELLLKLRDSIREDKQRYVMGQTLSSGTEGSSGLGGNGVADLHGQTKAKIIAHDSRNLAETMTGGQHAPGLVWMLQRWTFPETMPGRLNPNGFSARLVYDVDKPEPEKTLQAVQTAWSMGARFKEEEVVGLTGLSVPEEDDHILENPQIAQQKQQAAMQAQQGGGGPGGEPPPVGGPGGSGPGGPGDGGQPPPAQGGGGQAQETWEPHVLQKGPRKGKVVQYNPATGHYRDETEDFLQKVHSLSRDERAELFALLKDSEEAAVPVPETTPDTRWLDGLRAVLFADEPQHYAAADPTKWQPHILLSGPNKGQAAWKHIDTGEVTHEDPNAMASPEAEPGKPDAGAAPDGGSATPAHGQADMAKVEAVHKKALAAAASGDTAEVQAAIGEMAALGIYDLFGLKKKLEVSQPWKNKENLVKMLAEKLFAKPESPAAAEEKKTNQAAAEAKAGVVPLEKEFDAYLQDGISADDVPLLKDQLLGLSIFDLFKVQKKLGVKGWAGGKGSSKEFLVGKLLDALPLKAPAAPSGEAGPDEATLGMIEKLTTEYSDHFSEVMDPDSWATIGVSVTAPPDSPLAESLEGAGYKAKDGEYFIPHAEAGFLEGLAGDLGIWSKSEKADVDGGDTEGKPGIDLDKLHGIYPSGIEALKKAQKGEIDAAGMVNAFTLVGMHSVAEQLGVEKVALDSGPYLEVKAKQAQAILDHIQSKGKPGAKPALDLSKVAAINQDLADQLKHISLGQWDTFDDGEKVAFIAQLDGGHLKKAVDALGLDGKAIVKGASDLDSFKKQCAEALVAHVQGKSPGGGDPVSEAFPGHDALKASHPVLAKELSEMGKDGLHVNMGPESLAKHLGDKFSAPDLQKAAKALGLPMPVGAKYMDDYKQGLAESLVSHVTGKGKGGEKPGTSATPAQSMADKIGTLPPEYKNGVKVAAANSPEDGAAHLVAVFGLEGLKGIAAQFKVSVPSLAGPGDLATVKHAYADAIMSHLKGESKPAPSAGQPDVDSLSMPSEYKDVLKQALAGVLMPDSLAAIVPQEHLEQALAALGHPDLKPPPGSTPVEAEEFHAQALLDVLSGKQPGGAKSDGKPAAPAKPFNLNSAMSEMAAAGIPNVAGVIKAIYGGKKTAFDLKSFPLNGIKQAAGILGIAVPPHMANSTIADDPNYVANKDTLAQMIEAHVTGKGGGKPATPTSKMTRADIEKAFAGWDSTSKSMVLTDLAAALQKTPEEAAAYLIAEGYGIGSLKSLAVTLDVPTVNDAKAMAKAIADKLHGAGDAGAAAGVAPVAFPMEDAAADKVEAGVNKLLAGAGLTPGQIGGTKGKILTALQATNSPAAAAEYLADNINLLDMQPLAKALGVTPSDNKPAMAEAIVDKLQDMVSGKAATPSATPGEAWTKLRAADLGVYVEGAIKGIVSGKLSPEEAVGDLKWTDLTAAGDALGLDTTLPQTADYYDSKLSLLNKIADKLKEVSRPVPGKSANIDALDLNESKKRSLKAVLAGTKTAEDLATTYFTAEMKQMLEKLGAAVPDVADKPLEEKEKILSQAIVDHLQGKGADKEIPDAAGSKPLTDKEIPNQPIDLDKVGFVGHLAAPSALNVLKAVQAGTAGAKDLPSHFTLAQMNELASKVGLKMPDLSALLYKEKYKVASEAIANHLQGKGGGSGTPKPAGSPPKTWDAASINKMVDESGLDPLLHNSLKSSLQFALSKSGEEGAKHLANYTPSELKVVAQALGMDTGAAPSSTIGPGGFPNMAAFMEAKKEFAKSIVSHLKGTAPVAVASSPLDFNATVGRYHAGVKLLAGLDKDKQQALADQLGLGKLTGKHAGITAQKLAWHIAANWESLKDKLDSQFSETIGSAKSASVPPLVDPLKANLQELGYSLGVENAFKKGDPATLAAQASLPNLLALAQSLGIQPETQGLDYLPLKEKLAQAIVEKSKASTVPVPAPTAPPSNPFAWNTSKGNPPLDVANQLAAKYPGVVEALNGGGGKSHIFSVQTDGNPALKQALEDMHVHTGANGLAYVNGPHMQQLAAVLEKHADGDGAKPAPSAPATPADLLAAVKSVDALGPKQHELVEEALNQGPEPDHLAQIAMWPQLAVMGEALGLDTSALKKVGLAESEPGWLGKVTAEKQALAQAIYAKLADMAGKDKDGPGGAAPAGKPVDIDAIPNLSYGWTSVLKSLQDGSIEPDSLAGVPTNSPEDLEVLLMKTGATVLPDTAGMDDYAAKKVLAQALADHLQGKTAPIDTGASPHSPLSSGELSKGLEKSLKGYKIADLVAIAGKLGYGKPLGTTKGGKLAWLAEQIEKDHGADTSLIKKTVEDMIAAAYPDKQAALKKAFAPLLDPGAGTAKPSPKPAPPKPAAPKPAPPPPSEYDTKEAVLSAFPGHVTGTYSGTGGEKFAVKLPDDAPDALKQAVKDIAGASFSPSHNTYGVPVGKAADLAAALQSGGVEAEGQFPKPHELGGLKTVKSLGGSTGAKLVEFNGKQYVHKEGNSPAHVANEHAADQSYQALGIAVPKGKLYDAGGKTVKLAQYVEGGKQLGDFLKTAPEAQKQAALSQLRQNFVADALLANYDVIGMDADNVLVDASGKVWRIDNGGSFEYRAQGKKKTAEQWSDVVSEIASMRNPSINPSAAKIYGGITDAEIAAQVGQILKNKDKLLAAVPPSVKARMEKRLDWLAKHYPPPIADLSYKGGKLASAIKAKQLAGTPPDKSKAYKAPPADAGHIAFKSYAPGEERSGFSASTAPDSFKEHAKQLQADTPKAALAAAKKFTGNSYNALVEAMQECPETLDCLSADHKKWADGIDKAIAAQGVLETPINVWRCFSVGDPNEFHEFMQACQGMGQEVQLPGPKSTSTKTGSWHGNVVLEIKARTGIYAQPFSHYASEQEWLMSHHARFRVAGVKEVELKGMGKRKVVQLEEVVD